MVLNVAARRISPALAVLLWCALGAVLVHLVLVRAAPNPSGFSPIFWYLLTAYDAHGNLLLALIAVLAFATRRQPEPLALVRLAAEHPWRIAAIVLPLLWLGAATAYRGYPLSMDEYVAWFQAETFAAGKLDGQFPPDLMNELLPRFPPGFFFIASRPAGVITGTYTPGFALLMAPFAWLGVPWAANALISALTLPAVHRLAHAVTGSREAGGWALLLTLASPVFVISAFSYYAMPAHLLCNAVYALLLLSPTPARAALAGAVGSLALTLHNPAPHLLFAPAFVAWLALRRAPLAVFAALAAGYLPLVALLGWGWQRHLAEVLAHTSAAAARSIGTPTEQAAAGAASALVLPGAKILEARIAGLSKVWTWGSAGLMVFAAYGLAAARAIPAVRALAAALALTFAGYLFVRFDQGHGWGFRYLHSAWFVLPVLAGLALARLEDADTRNLAGWAIVMSLVLANGLRIAQVNGFIAQHLAQVPPLARPADPARPEVIFVDPAAGAYVRDMLHNDPFLRGGRVVLYYDGPAAAAALMARRFPDYAKRAEGKWGEQWTR
ncbi:MAG TPA: hypothetical protein VMT02_03900 [Burkholderiales bacterium]|nr:hypothetical protein [Burkholderiales bacterium]